MLRGSLRRSESLSSPTKEAAASASLRGGISVIKKSFVLGWHRSSQNKRLFEREVFSRQAQSSRYSLTPLVAYLCCKDIYERLIEEEEQNSSP